jgi:phage/plasmid-like protein (TIGR03299 family)
MSANIKSMFYTGAKPWHNLGKKLEKAATAEEAIVTAGLDWKVQKRPALVQTDAGIKEVPGEFAVVRTDTETPLGIVGKRFTPVQNKDAFRFFDAVVGVKEAIYHTAGALGDGERVWILAQLNGVVKTSHDDIVEKYLLLANGHDGSLTLQMLLTPIRVVCQNTLNQAINSSIVSAKLRHTKSIGLKVEEVREALGIVNQQFSIFEEASQRLAAIKVSDKSYSAYLSELGLAPKGERTDENAKSYDRQLEVANLLRDLRVTGKGADLVSAKGTAWGAYNAVVEYVDHFSNPRVAAGKDQARAKSLLFGAGANLKGEAFTKALQLA